MPKKDGSPTVAERRAAGTNKKAQNQAAKATGGVRPGSVADNRAKAKEKAQTMKEYKTENNINKAPTRKKEERQQPARQEREGSVAYNRANNTNTPSTGSGNESAGVDSNKFTTAAGYQMEKGAYNQSVTNMYETYRKDNPSSGLSHMDPDLASFDEEGYLSYDSTKPMWQANGMLKEAGYKVGDMLWKPGTKDNLNGRELTGRIGRISPNGLYSAEYVNDAVNSSHQSTGNAGYQGEVGLGADQSAYNRQYEQENDVEYGQVNQQLEANGFDTKQYAAPDGNQYAAPEQGNTPAAQQSNSHSVMPQMRLPKDPTSETAAHNSQTNLWNSNDLFKNKGLGMDFSFNPGRFNQGQ